MKIPIYQVDAFAEEPFAGNPAAVCPLETWPDDSLLLNIASENNLSETAFFVEREGEYELRWFTPENEVDLCGHATLATAYVIFEELNYEKDLLEFKTQSGELEVYREGNYFSMDFPSRPPEPSDRDESIIAGLGVEPAYVFESRDYMAVYESEEQIRSLDPDMSLLKEGAWTGIIATAEGKTVDFVSRFFAPGEGIPEDPVTGSAHCTLVPYWSERLGKKNLKARQVSSRGGKLACQDLGSRVKIKGSAVLFLKGEIRV
ncbi:MAG: PhzF family phenazine biosynthesis protein [Candidatus Bipolaricaulota bacterium]